ncbi:MAG: dihydroorotase [Candidatus Binatia bacterium]|nr:MAG: dihydroorotase [Candidatus Binatia bacterium]
MSLWVRGGLVIDPARDFEAIADVHIVDGRIAAISESSSTSIQSDDTVIPAEGLWVVPGLVDMHVHLREPGFEYKETVASGTAAAVAGGFTAVAAMANTMPVNDCAAVTELILERARMAGLARVYPIGAVSKGLEGKELAEIGEMHRAGVVAISDDGQPIQDGALMRRALEYAAMFGLPVIAHEEDRQLGQGGVMNEGEWSFRLGLRGIPKAAEEAMVARDLAILERTGGRLHIAHISTAGAVELVRAAKRRGLPVTAEATPHHFTLTEAAVAGYNTQAKMNPPLRTEADVRAVREGLLDGTIDCVASDHAPHHEDEKRCEFDRAANGIIGLETTLALTLAMARETGWNRKRMIAALSTNPARILSVPGGTLAVGAPADLTLIDPNLKWVLHPEEVRSRSKNTPFLGWELQGRAVMTIVGGEIKWRLGERRQGETE